MTASTYEHLKQVRWIGKTIKTVSLLAIRLVGRRLLRKYACRNVHQHDGFRLWENRPKQVCPIAADGGDRQ
jgi:hypothetical protein